MYECTRLDGRWGEDRTPPNRAVAIAFQDDDPGRKIGENRMRSLFAGAVLASAQTRFCPGRSRHRRVPILSRSFQKFANVFPPHRSLSRLGNESHTGGTGSGASTHQQNTYRIITPRVISDLGKTWS